MQQRSEDCAVSDAGGQQADAWFSVDFDLQANFQVIIRLCLHSISASHFHS